MWTSNLIQNISNDEHSVDAMASTLVCWHQIQYKSFWASQYANKPNQIFNPQVVRTEILFIGLWPHHEVTFTKFPDQRTNIDIMLEFSFSFCEISIKTYTHTMSIDIIQNMCKKYTYLPRNYPALWYFKWNEFIENKMH